jgi:hypothetical protein
MNPFSRSAIGEGRFRLGPQNWHEPLQQSLIGVVVGFSDPDVFCLRKPDTFVPLFEGAAGIDLIEFEPHAGIRGVFAKNRPAVVSRAIVQQDQFEVLEGLCEDRVNAAPQETGVVVVRHDDANLRHGLAVHTRL